MSKLGVKLSVLVLSMACASASWSSAKLETIRHISGLSKYVQKVVNKNGSEHTLLVFDDDDTLLKMPQALGSVGWWNWQSKLLAENPQSGDLVSDNFNGLLQVQVLLDSVSNMDLVSNKTPVLLKNWQKSGITTMVLSARGPDMDNATLRQLSVFDLSQGFKNHGLKMRNGSTSLPGSFYPCGNSSMRPVSYENGVYNGSGQNKGVLLRCLLDRAGKTKKYTSIILIDDTLKNDQQFVEAYKHIKGVDVYALHYTKLHNAKEEQLKNPRLHTQMVRSWNKIKSILGETLTKPNLPGA
tara:strand:- start:1366 stop:2256 length:891 start_codon:yes stop_codon:yes gene_type:complete